MSKSKLDRIQEAKASLLRLFNKTAHQGTKELVAEELRRANSELYAEERRLNAIKENKQNENDQTL